MKAYQVAHARRLDLIDIPEPASPGPNDVLLRFGAMGICGSDLLVYQGLHPFVKEPRIVGHEFAGTVLDVGAEVTGLQPGDRVCVEPILSCGHCAPCRRGDYHVCTTVKVLGCHVEGVCAEQIIVPQEHVFKLPDGLPLEEGAAIEPICVGLETARRAGLEARDRMVIFGAGPIGIACLKVARAFGVEQSLVIDRVPERLAVAERHGATGIHLAGEPGLEEKVAALGEGETAPVLVESSGAGEAFAEAMRVAPYRSRIVLLSLHKETRTPLPTLEIVKKELDILGSRLYKNRFPVALDLLREGRLTLDSYVTHRFPFASAAEAFQLALDPPGDGTKIVITAADGEC